MVSLGGGLSAFEYTVNLYHSSESFIRARSGLLNSYVAYIA